MSQQVFYDPRRARWKRLRRLFDVAGVSITLLIIFFVYAALRNEQLPALLLPERKHPYHALKEKEKEKAKEHRRLLARRTHRKSKTAPSQAKLNAEGCRIPIIFITAHGDAKMRMQALRAGAVEFLAKPFDDEALLESVRAALES